MSREAADCAGEVPTCEDGQRNGAESDVDCGGVGCEACADGSACVEDRDCASELCVRGACAVSVLNVGPAPTGVPYVIQ